MNSQLFFLLNFALAGLFLVWFLSSRKNSGAKPTQLSLKKGPNASAENKAVSQKLKSEPTPETKTNPPRSEVWEETPVPRTEKTLNVLFIYNGHDWDAYEVLGVPAGASLPLVTERYQELIKTCDSGKREFLEAAYQAILKKI